MLLASYPLAARPLSSAWTLPRPYRPYAINGEYGFAAWSFSRQAKLNAWAWHGLGTNNINSWAALGNFLYFRKEDDTYVHVMAPDTFLAATDVSTDSTSVEATTQWLDFGKPGKMKALTGIDFDGSGIETVEVYISVNGGRAGDLAETVQVSLNNGGWTYNGEVIPLNVAATEFKLRFIGNAKTEATVNRLTLYWEPIDG